MPKEVKEILADIKEFVGDDEAKAAEVANEIHKQQQPVAQVLIDRGAKGAKDEGKAKLKKATDDLKVATERVETLEGELETAREKGPENEQKLQKKIEQLTEQVKAKDEALKAEQTGRKMDRRSVAIERFVKKLRPGVDVREEYANEVAAAKYADRFEIAEDGSLQVKQLEKDEFYRPADGKDPVDLLVADVIKKAPDWARLSGVDTGGGEGGRGRGIEGEMTEDKIVEEKLAGNTYRTL